MAVALSVASGSGSLGGTASQTTDINGLAHFTDLFFNAAGLKQLQAASGSATVNSSSFAITNATATALAIAAQPSSTAIAGAALATQPVVQVQDTFGNVVSNSTVSVSAAQTAGGNLNQTAANSVSAGAAAGTATFSGLYLTNATGGNTLTFTSSGLTGATSGVINVTATVPGIMSMNTQPSGTAVAGVAFVTQPAVNVADAYGNIVTNGTAVAAGSSSGNLQGTTGRTTTGGVASFTNLALTNSGSSTLTFTSGSASVNSSAINVSPATATQLGFTTQPGGASYGSKFSVQPVVSALDQYGNASTSGLPASLVVSQVITKGNGPLLVRETTHLGMSFGSPGVATFTKLQINTLGTNQLLVTLASSGRQRAGLQHGHPLEPLQLLLQRRERFHAHHRDGLGVARQRRACGLGLQHQRHGVPQRHDWQLHLTARRPHLEFHECFLRGLGHVRCEHPEPVSL